MEDPTAIPHLQKLRETVLADRDVRRMLVQLRRSSRVALVLSGGGGKGAYEAGVLLALFDCGVRKLCSLAGTSVGGLNATLYHQMCLTKDRNLVLRIWSEMSLKKVMGWSWGAPLKLLLYIPLSFQAAITMSPFMVFLHASSENSSASDAASESLPSLLTLVKSILFYAILLYIVTMILWEIGFLWLSLSNILTDVYLSIYKERIDADRGYIHFIITVYGPCIAGLLTLLAMFLTLNFSIFSNRRLRQTIESHLQRSIFAVPPPVVITLAEYVRPLGLLFGQKTKANYVTLQTVGKTGHEMFDYVQQTAAHPEFPVTLQQEEEAIDLLIQTAAIPEIFLTRFLRKARLFLCVDGGIADNTPILGVAVDRPDTVIVVYLDARISKLENTLRNNVKEVIYRRNKSSSYKDPKVTKDLLMFFDNMSKEHPKSLWLLRRICDNTEILWRGTNALDWLDNTRFLPIVPSRSLGELGGTFDFFAAIARKLMASVGEISGTFNFFTATPRTNHHSRRIRWNFRFFCDNGAKASRIGLRRHAAAASANRRNCSAED